MNGEDKTNGAGFVDESILLEPLSYLVSVPGNGFRQKFAMALNHWFKIPAEILNKIMEIVDLLHNSSLLIDDIEDGSELRRGVPAAHRIYGVGRTINCANYAYFVALHQVKSLNHPKAVDAFLRLILESHRGQGMELHWRDTLQCPTEEQYNQAVIRKSGAILLLCWELMQLFCQDRRDLSTLISLIAKFFQIRDDYLNLQSDQYAQMKSYCEDLTEGKFGFPIIHAIRCNHSKSGQVAAILKQRTRNVKLKRRCVLLMERVGSFAYTREVLAKIYEDIQREIELLGGNPPLEALMEKLTSPVVIPKNTSQSDECYLRALSCNGGHA